MGLFGMVPPGGVQGGSRSSEARSTAGSVGPATGQEGMDHQPRRATGRRPRRREIMAEFRATSIAPRQGVGGLGYVSIALRSHASMRLLPAAKQKKSPGRQSALLAGEFLPPAESLPGVVARRVREFERGPPASRRAHAVRERSPSAARFSGGGADQGGGVRVPRTPTTPVRR